ncbi:MAG: hypothetical protein EWV63_15760 [Microcystis aeruginosa Ma_OC_H_19870700_S124]|uniref:Uncharacterized protein n=1 Tax=Microcystis aeruginosa Ma_OC_H_19870700_S124 TaxID=2486262 RepID=A0A552AFI8_MICAE|nr:hypothetical protein [Microcystis wesenbergii]MBD2118278.1 hypothetical protein [Microcystis wesenbergii FACHB-1339]TRT84243.1 MAG: hypothetical protein EWV63_15760 [Microcystis aeruginosa Ma_OC_H_19870700_S124]
MHGSEWEGRSATTFSTPNIKDGVITRIEFESIKTIMFSNKKNNPDQILRQVTLYRHLVVEKLNNSELIFESPQ